MNTDMTWQIKSTSSEQTELVGASLGARLRGGEIIELRSDLGGGKTTFVRGLARGAGSQDAVGSPSFTISKLYKTDKLVIHHYDFYRLAEPGLMAEELHEALTDPQVVCVVEWADVVDDVLPAERLVVNISTTGENDRSIVFECPAAYRHLQGGA